MKNDHLIPPSIFDIIDRMNHPTVGENELSNYIIRLEAIRDICDQTLKKHENSKKIFNRSYKRKN